MDGSILFTHKVRKYKGQYVAVIGGKVIASGKSAKEVFKSAKKIARNKNVEGIYYIPQKEDLLIALCVFRTSN